MSRGAVTCTGVAVGSTMPASTVCSRAYSAPSAPQAPTGGTRGLDPGETLTITYEQIIANTAPCATITNTATTTDRATQTGTTDITGVAATKTSSASLTIACYDLAITKVVSPKPGVRPGGTVTWTITVTNNGPGAMVGPAATDANPLIITDTFPVTGVAAPVLVSSVGPAGACTRSGSTITCPSSLPAAGVQVLTFTQAVNAGATNGTRHLEYGDRLRPEDGGRQRLEHRYDDRPDPRPVARQERPARRPTRASARSSTTATWSPTPGHSGSLAR